MENAQFKNKRIKRKTAMSIQSEITLLQSTKNEIGVAIMEKGVTVYDSDLFSTYPTRISQISMTPGDKDALFRSILERNVTELEIPEGAKYVAGSRFRDITTLTSLTIPSTVTYIDEGAFYNCSSLQSITVNAATPPSLIYHDVVGSEHWPLDNTNDCPIYVPRNSVLTYKTAWPQYASRIYAQASPYALFNSMVDGSVSGAFEIPDGTLRIGDTAFYGLSGITSVTVPDSVTSIGSYAFSECSSMVSITFTSERPPAADYESFTGIDPNLVIYVPSASVDAYKHADKWSTYASQIQAIPT